VRVVSGFARGHKLICLEGDAVRPTSDRAKEAIFSALGHKVASSFFLDMFSGSGAIGIEALSHGAAFVAFVEAEISHTDIIQRNLAHVSKAISGSNYKVINDDAGRALLAFKSAGTKFDIIFMDPPYKSLLWKTVLNNIYEMNILREHGIVIVEMGKDEPKPVTPHFNIIKNKVYGAASVYYMELDQ